MVQRISARLTLVLVSCLPAQALEVRCIEAAKYKHLAHMFQNDAIKLAEFVGAQAFQLPSSDACRAVLITGKIGPTEGRVTYDDTLRDVDKVLQVVARNKGWLATIHLSSFGGNVMSGMLLGELARVLLLKTRSVDRDVSEYIPDFGMVVADQASNRSGRTTVQRPEPIELLADGWRSYLKAISESTRTIRVSSGQGRCASACSDVLVGGVERQGVVYVHRPHMAPRIQGAPRSIKSFPIIEAAIEQVADYLEAMDAGETIIQGTRSVPSGKAVPARAPRFPSEIAHRLARECRVNVAEVASKNQRPSSGRTRGRKSPAAPIRAELARPRAERDAAEICFVRILEQQRLTAFAQYCRDGICDRQRLLEEIEARLLPVWSRWLAERGDADAQFDLARSYGRGKGVAQSDSEAAKWYRLAAEQGHAIAQYSLGLRYIYGRGVPADLNEAVKWLCRAAAQGLDPSTFVGLGLWASPDECRRIAPRG
jgi:hypothetical protein